MNFNDKRDNLKKYEIVNECTNTAVVTEDLGMILRCEKHGIKVIQLTKDLRLEDPQSELQKKYKVAITDLNNIKNSKPDLQIFILPSNTNPGDTTKYEISLSRQLTTMVNTENELTRKNEEYKKCMTPKSNISMFQNLALSISNDEYKRYQKEWDEYINAYKLWIPERNSLAEMMTRKIEFKIFVQNKGKSPATGVEVKLSFPSLFNYFFNEETGNGIFPNIPKEPQAPKPPRTMSEMVKASINHHNNFDMPFFPNTPRMQARDEPSMDIDRNSQDGFNVLVDIPKIKHYESMEFDTIAAVFKTWDVIQPFEIDLNVTAENIQEKVTRKIPVIVRVLYP
jgi:hypothetical protein